MHWILWCSRVIQRHVGRLWNCPFNESGHVQGRLLFTFSCSDVLSSLVITNTSCAVLPLRAISLCPPRIGIDTRSSRVGHRPLTLVITAGVIV